jgi:hypothetical protein
MAKTRAARTRKKAVRSASKRTPAARPSRKGGQARTKAVRVKSAARKRQRSGAKKTGSRRAAPAPARKSTLKTAAAAVGRAVSGTVATVVAHTPWGATGNDAIELLETDHRRLEELLARGEGTTARSVKTRTALLDIITRELNAHELIEEKILYPALKSHSEAKDIVLEGYQEHHVADLIVKELHGLARSDERWGAKFKVLKENIEHHIEEEEGEMFRTARAVLSREQLEEMGARMRQMKSEALGR